MAETVSPITSLANSSITTLISLANTLANVISTTVVTANGAANGALTTGNGYVSGIFGAAILAAGMLRGGTVQTPGPLNIGANTWVNASSLSVGNTTVNSTMNSINLSIQTVNVTNAVVGFFPQSNLTFSNTSFLEVNKVTTGTSQQVLDSFLLTQARSVEYILQVKDNAANGYQVSKLLLVHDGTTPLWTEYGLLNTNTVLATFNASGNSTAIALNITPTTANANIRVLRTTLAP